MDTPLPSISVNDLLSHDFFTGLDPATIQEIIDTSRSTTLEANTALFKYGDQAGSMYVVIRGIIGVYVPQQNNLDLVKRLKKGDIVGEMAIISDQPRSATIIAIRDSILLEITRENFEKIIISSPQSSLSLLRTVVARLRETTVNKYKPQTIPVQTFAIVPLCHTASIQEFSNKLAQFIGKHRSLALVTETMIYHWVDNHFQELKALPRSIEERLPCLDSLEDLYQAIFYKTNYNNPQWTQFCIRQADKVLNIIDLKTQVNQQNLEITYRETTGLSTSESELVFVHRSKPEGLDQITYWLDKLKIDTHFNISLDNPEHISRIGRHQLGEAVGMALGGGGARGIAYIGFYRALQEYNIPIDYIGGTSIGAIASSQMALGYSWEDIKQFSYDNIIVKRVFKQYALPIFSLLDDSRLRDGLKSTYGDQLIEHTEIPFFCVAINLSNAQQVILKRGKIREAVRASSAIPGVLAPAIHEQDLLIDGALLNNMPSDVLVSHNAIKHVIAGNISPVIQSKFHGPDFHYPRPIKYLLNRIFRRDFNFKIPPTLTEVISRSIVIPTDAQIEEKKKSCDLFFDPPVEKFKTMDWHRIEELVELGYNYGVKKIEAWESRHSIIR